MVRAIVEARALVAMSVAAVVGTWGLHAYPVNDENVYLALIALRNPMAFHVLVYGYATLWFSTPFCTASFVLSGLTIAFYRHVPTARLHPLPRYPEPEARLTPTLVLGEAHFPTVPGRAPTR